MEVNKLYLNIKKSTATWHNFLKVFRALPLNFSFSKKSTQLSLALVFFSLIPVALLSHLMPCDRFVAPSTLT